MKIHKNDDYAMMLIFQKNADVRVERDLKMRTRGKGYKIFQSSFMDGP